MKPRPYQMWFSEEERHYLEHLLDVARSIEGDEMVTALHTKFREAYRAYKDRSPKG